MKAVRIHAFGGPEVMSLDDVPAPEPGEGEILVDIFAASVNPADWKAREGYYKDAPWLRLPHIPGRDFSGVVRSLGPGADGFAPGDAVFGVTDQGQEGAYAEAIAMKAAIVAPKPESLTHTEAAAMALGALTALVSLEETGRIGAGETILIQGGAGGVGAMAVQIAKHAGAYVIATARAENRGYVLSLGADEVIDYARPDALAGIPPCDIVFDTVGGEAQIECCDVLKPGGRLVWIARGPEGFSPPDTIEVLRPNVARGRSHLDRIRDLVAIGALKPPRITTFSLRDAAEAQEKRKSGEIRGKAVLDVR